jgi:hypothetical protein
MVISSMVLSMNVRRAIAQCEGAAAQLAVSYVFEERGSRGEV